VFGDEQPPVTGAVADGVSGEFVHGENDVTGAALGYAGLSGVRGYGRPQRIQGPCVEVLLQDRCAAGAGAAAGRVWLLRVIRGHGQSPG
jgi:hypothetical protein